MFTLRHLTTVFTLLLLVACQTDQGADAGITPAAENYRGKWVVINYWAQWCAPCREEIPELNRLALEDPERIIVLGVNFDGLQGDALQRAVADMGIEFSVAEQDPATTFGYTLPRALPTTYLYDPRGRLAHQLEGPHTQAQLMQLITPL